MFKYLIESHLPDEPEEITVSEPVQEPARRVVREDADSFV